MGGAKIYEKTQSQKKRLGTKIEKNAQHLTFRRLNKKRVGSQK